MSKEEVKEDVHGLQFYNVHKYIFIPLVAITRLQFIVWAPIEGEKVIQIASLSAIAFLLSLIAYFFGMESMKALRYYEMASIVSLIIAIILVVDTLLHAWYTLIKGGETISLVVFIEGLSLCCLYTSSMFHLNGLYFATMFGWVIDWVTIAFDFVIVQECREEDEVCKTYFGVACAHLSVVTILIFVLCACRNVLNPNFMFAISISVVALVTKIPSLATSFHSRSYVGNSFISFQMIFIMAFLFKTSVYDVLIFHYRHTPLKDSSLTFPRPKVLVYLFCPFVLIAYLVLTAVELFEDTGDHSVTAGLTIPMTLFIWLGLGNIFGKPKMDDFMAFVAYSAFTITALLVCGDTIYHLYRKFEGSNPQNGYSISHIVLGHVSVFIFSLYLLSAEIPKVIAFLPLVSWIECALNVGALAVYTDLDDPESSLQSVLVYVAGLNLVGIVLLSLFANFEGTGNEMYLVTAIVIDVLTRIPSAATIGMITSSEINGFLVFRLIMDIVSLPKGCCLIPWFLEALQAAQRKKAKQFAKEEEEKKKKSAAPLTVGSPQPASP
mmetsp:Transcript_14137/g.21470  ORF Transcript_14137/g.21470 Transcript_14137/m.21470 type:complete len:551 (+) Transcript_14137:60-1712(+)